MTDIETVTIPAAPPYPIHYEVHGVRTVNRAETRVILIRDPEGGYGWALADGEGLPHQFSDHIEAMLASRRADRWLDGADYTPDFTTLELREVEGRKAREYRKAVAAGIKALHAALT